MTRALLLLLAMGLVGCSEPSPAPVFLWHCMHGDTLYYFAVGDSCPSPTHWTPPGRTIHATPSTHLNSLLDTLRVGDTVRFAPGVYGDTTGGRQ